MITLYQFEHCPYCQKVRVALDKKNLEYETVEVPNDRFDPVRKELLEKSGVPTVPVIDIDGKFIGESADIIEYIEEHL
ncbi:MAG: glutaredoxin [Nanoarchaeota archaeon]|nr:glutaredoxin [Nanoarchaeota archaeon]|tara:strand:- start:3945 stop:4178 length:234 start_codon:yes stop_codon:yes gene_type:complete